jgi:hypothetical protein
MARQLGSFAIPFKTLSFRRLVLIAVPARVSLFAWRSCAVFFGWFYSSF